MFLNPDKTWFIEEIEQQWSCRCSKSKTGGEILVRIDLGEKTSLVLFFFFFFWLVSCDLLHPDFGFLPQFWQKWCPVPQVWGPVWINSLELTSFRRSSNLKLPPWIWWEKGAKSLEDWGRKVGEDLVGGKSLYFEFCTPSSQDPLGSKLQVSSKYLTLPQSQKQDLFSNFYTQIAGLQEEYLHTAKPHRQACTQPESAKPCPLSTTLKAWAARSAPEAWLQSSIGPII